MNAQPPEPQNQLDELISGHLENELTETQREQLNQVLKKDAIARDRFLTALRQDILLGEVLREQVERQELRSPLEVSKSQQTNVWKTEQAHRNWRAAIAAAALLVLALTLYLTFHKSAQKTNVAAANLRATVLRNGVTSPLTDGAVLVTKDSSLLVEYEDHTKVTLKENSTATFGLTPTGGKSILLDSGVLSADAAKQSARHPMVIRTADSEATVLGTRFTFRAELGKSTLTVEEGRVRLERRSDQKLVEVSAGHIAVCASNAPEIELKSIVPSVLPSHRNVLLITADPIPFYPHDVAIKAALEELGFTVTEKVFSEATDEDATGKELIVIPSHRCTGGHIFTNTPVPVICWHPVWYEELGMTDPTAPKMDSLKPERLSFISHPVLVGVPVPLDGTTLTVYARAKPASSAEVIATIPGQPDQAVIFGYEKESKLQGVGTHARRLAFSIDVRNNKQSPAELPKQLFKAAVKWTIATKE